MAYRRGRAIKTMAEDNLSELSVTIRNDKFKLDSESTKADVIASLYKDFKQLKENIERHQTYQTSKIQTPALIRAAKTWLELAANDAVKKASVILNRLKEMGDESSEIWTEISKAVKEWEQLRVEAMS